MKMKDSGFEQEWKHLAVGYRRARCPKSTAELDREVRRVTWADHPVPLEMQVSKRPLRWLWPAVAAACLLAVLVPGTMHHGSGLQAVVVDGESLYFACNNDCSPSGTLKSFNNFIQ